MGWGARERQNPEHQNSWALVEQFAATSRGSFAQQSSGVAELVGPGSLRPLGVSPSPPALRLTMNCRPPPGGLQRFAETRVGADMAPVQAGSSLGSPEPSGADDPAAPTSPMIFSPRLSISVTTPDSIALRIQLFDDDQNASVPPQSPGNSVATGYSPFVPTLPTDASPPTAQLTDLSAPSTAGRSDVSEATAPSARQRQLVFDVATPSAYEPFVAPSASPTRPSTAAEPPAALEPPPAVELPSSVSPGVALLGAASPRSDGVVFPMPPTQHAYPLHRAQSASMRTLPPPPSPDEIASVDFPMPPTDRPPTDRPPDRPHPLRRTASGPLPAPASGSSSASGSPSGGARRLRHSREATPSSSHLVATRRHSLSPGGRTRVPLGGPISPSKRLREVRLVRKTWHAWRSYRWQRLTTRTRAALSRRTAARSAFLALLDHCLRRCILASSALDARRHHDTHATRAHLTHWHGLCSMRARHIVDMRRAADHLLSVTTRHRYARGLAALLARAMTHAVRVALDRTGKHARLQRAVGRWALGAAHRGTICDGRVQLMELTWQSLVGRAHRSWMRHAMLLGACERLSSAATAFLRGLQHLARRRAWRRWPARRALWASRRWVRLELHQRWIWLCERTCQLNASSRLLAAGAGVGRSRVLTRSLRAWSATARFLATLRCVVNAASTRAGARAAAKALRTLRLFAAVQRNALHSARALGLNAAPGSRAAARRKQLRDAFTHIIHTLARRRFLERASLAHCRGWRRAAALGRWRDARFASLRAAASWFLARKHSMRLMLQRWHTEAVERAQRKHAASRAESAFFKRVTTRALVHWTVSSQSATHHDHAATAPIGLVVQDGAPRGFHRVDSLDMSRTPGGSGAATAGGGALAVLVAISDYFEASAPLLLPALWRHWVLLSADSRAAAELMRLATLHDAAARKGASLWHWRHIGGCTVGDRWARSKLALRAWRVRLRFIKGRLWRQWRASTLRRRAARSAIREMLIPARPMVIRRNKNTARNMLLAWARGASVATRLRHCGGGSAVAGSMRCVWRVWARRALCHRASVELVRVHRYNRLLKYHQGAPRRLAAALGAMRQAVWDRRMRVRSCRLPPRLRRTLVRWRWAAKALGSRRVLYRAQQVAAALGAAALETRLLGAGFRAFVAATAQHAQLNGLARMHHRHYALAHGFVAFAVGGTRVSLHESWNVNADRRARAHYERMILSYGWHAFACDTAVKKRHLKLSMRMRVGTAFGCWHAFGAGIVAESDAMMMAMMHERSHTRRGALQRVRRGTLRRRAIRAAADAALVLASDCADVAATRMGFLRWSVWVKRMHKRATRRAEEADADAALRALAAEMDATAKATAEAHSASLESIATARAVADDRVMDEVAAAAAAVAEVEAQLKAMQASNASQVAEHRATVNAIRAEAATAAAAAAAETQSAWSEVKTALAEMDTLRAAAGDAEEARADTASAVAEVGAAKAVAETARAHAEAALAAAQAEILSARAEVESMRSEAQQAEDGRAQAATAQSAAEQSMRVAKEEAQAARKVSESLGAARAAADAARAVAEAACASAEAKAKAGQAQSEEARAAAEIVRAEAEVSKAAAFAETQAAKLDTRTAKAQAEAADGAKVRAEAAQAVAEADAQAARADAAAARAEAAEAAKAAEAATAEAAKAAEAATAEAEKVEAEASKRDRASSASNGSQDQALDQALAEAESAKAEVQVLRSRANSLSATSAKSIEKAEARLGKTQVEAAAAVLAAEQQAKEAIDAAVASAAAAEAAKSAEAAAKASEQQAQAQLRQVLEQYAAERSHGDQKPAEPSRAAAEPSLWQDQLAEAFEAARAHEQRASAAESRLSVTLTRAEEMHKELEASKVASEAAVMAADAEKSRAQRGETAMHDELERVRAELAQMAAALAAAQSEASRAAEIVALAPVAAPEVPVHVSEEMEVMDAQNIALAASHFAAATAAASAEAEAATASIACAQAQAEASAARESAHRASTARATAQVELSSLRAQLYEEQVKSTRERAARQAAEEAARTATAAAEAATTQAKAMVDAAAERAMADEASSQQAYQDELVVSNGTAHPVDGIAAAMPSAGRVGSVKRHASRKESLLHWKTSDDLTASLATARMAVPKRLREQRDACVQIQRAWRHRQSAHGHASLPRVSISTPVVGLPLISPQFSDLSFRSDVRGVSFSDEQEASANGGDDTPGAEAVAQKLLEELAAAGGNQAPSGVDDTPDWLQWAAADVGVNFVSPQNAPRPSGGSNTPASAAPKAPTSAPNGAPASTTPSPPLEALNGHAVATPAAAAADPPTNGGLRQHHNAATATTPYSGRGLLELSDSPGGSLELVRRARRRLAMVAADGGTDGAIGADDGVDDDDDDEDDDATLTSIYYMRTKLAGRALLNAWLTLRELRSPE